MAIGILFVCMGNICRSPAAEGVFIHRIRERDLDHLFKVDSAGTGGWHAGDDPDHRSMAEGRRRGIHLPGTARQVHSGDWVEFDMIVCMDRENHANLLRAGAPKEKLRMLLEWHPEHPGGDVPDPYYGGDDGFVYMYDLIETACDRMLDHLVQEHGPTA